MKIGFCFAYVFAVACVGYAVCVNKNIPADGMYYLTSFCDPQTSCGPSCGNCDWYYAADSQRFGCGATITCSSSSTGQSVNLKIVDLGPSCSVETSAGRPVIDASPLACRALGKMSECGWSDHVSIKCKIAMDASEVMYGLRLPLGPCTLDRESATSEVPWCLDTNATGHWESFKRAYGDY
eukprot:ANDGO_00933.mRNA.1 Lysozyme A